MIGKTQWFQRRKFGGWGLAPKTWQSWAYIAALIGLFGLIQVLPLGNPDYNLIATIVLLILVIADTIDIMIHLPMDERDRIHEAMAERNALWTMLAVLIGGLIWQATTGAISRNPQIDPVIIIALFSAVITKAFTNLYLERKN